MTASTTITGGCVKWVCVASGTDVKHELPRKGLVDQLKRPAVRRSTRSLGASYHPENLAFGRRIIQVDP
jgi:hypothetical protein